MYSGKIAVPPGGGGIGVLSEYNYTRYSSPRAAAVLWQGTIV
jgi:hypothetical protein